MIDNLIWDEISLEVLKAARSGMAVKDFELHCRLAPITNGKSFFDRIRVAESLIQDKLISIDDGYLKIANKMLPESLVNKLITGLPIAWEILDCLDLPKKYLNKLDYDLLNRIGLDGELAVINELKKILPIQVLSRIIHISLVDDSAGFDIQSPSIKFSDENMFLEVKTSVRPGDKFSFYISKNEARVAKQNDNWFLIGVESKPSGCQILGFLTFNMFSDLLPINQSSEGQWESAKIVIPKKIFIEFLP